MSAIRIKRLTNSKRFDLMYTSLEESLDQWYTHRGMLEKPKNGWTLFKLPDINAAFSLSYLDDIPVEWMEQAICGLRDSYSFTVHGDLEPAIRVCTVGCHNSVVFVDNKPTETTVWHSSVGKLDFCKSLFVDIAENLEDWLYWDVNLLPDEEEESTMSYKEKVDERTATLLNHLSDLKKAIQWMSARI